MSIIVISNLDIKKEYKKGTRIFLKRKGNDRWYRTYCPEFLANTVYGIAEEDEVEPDTSGSF